MPIVLVVNDFQETENESDNEHLIDSVRFGIEQILTFATKKSNKLEYIALIAGKDSCPSVLSRLTRDYNSIRENLDKLTLPDRLDWWEIMSCVNELIFEEWMMEGKTYVYCIVGEHPIKATKSRKRPASPEPDFQFKFDFESHTQIMIMAEDGEATKRYYEKVLTQNGQKGSVECINWKNNDIISRKFTNSISLLSPPHLVTLLCGKISCQVQLYPPVKPFSGIVRHELINKRIGSKLKIYGFISLTDLASPPFFSKHFLIPTGSKSDETPKKDEDRGNVPNITVLLHGSLKVRQMAAVVQLAPNWFGLICSCSDSKKKSNLILYVLEAGTEPVTWLGDFSSMVIANELSENNPFLSDKKSPFPIKSDERPSYNQPTISWIKSTGIQADIQKVVRFAKKLPDKETLFYKEVNRVKKAALSYGFTALIQGLSDILEREMTSNESLSNSAKDHLNRTVTALRSPSVFNVDYIISSK